MAIEVAERGWVPDWLIRWGIRRQLARRATHARDTPIEEKAQQLRRLLLDLRSSAIAEQPDRANRQHYELPPEFFECLLGPRRKYSACYWPTDQASLEGAEEAMLALTCERAGIQNGQDILELGCGWGSLCLFIAERYKASTVTAVSNSHSQRAYIQQQAKNRGLDNILVQTADLNHFTPDRRFDRIVSIECFEHLRNYEQMFERLQQWLTPTGRCFLHVFCHRELAYPFDARDPSDWMARHFFTGGMMPSFELFLHFPQNLAVVDRWAVNGRHYQKTLLAWLARLDDRRDEALRILQHVYGPRDAKRWLQRWRIFLLACAELFAFHNGSEWFVAHYLFEPVPTANQVHQDKPLFKSHHDAFAHN